MAALNNALARASLNMRDERRQVRPRPCIAACAFLAIYLVLAIYASTQNAPAVDEPAHLAAGVSYWGYGTFNLYPVNPPLCKVVAAAPVCLCRPQTNWNRVDLATGIRSEWLVGSDFLAANESNAFLLIVLARCACALLSLLGGIACYRWASDLYGAPSGLLALALWAFCPSLLGYAGVIGADAGAAATGVLACYAYWRWFRARQWRDAIAAGVCLGAAELTKLSWLPLLLVLPFVGATASIGLPLRRRNAAQMAFIVLVALGTLNAGYGLQGTVRALADYDFVSHALSGNYQTRDASAPGNRFRGHWLGSLLLPLPEAYVTGVDLQLREFESGRACYIRGEFVEGGCWWYYLYALAVKVPLGTVALICLGAMLAATRGAFRANWRDELLLFAAPLALLIVLAVNARGAYEYRYAVPCLPFAFVHASRVARSVQLGHRWISATALGGAILTALSSLSVYPHCLSYFNEAAGGPSGGHWHLGGSAIDLGQDLFRLKNWLEQHPEARPLHLAYSGALDPRSIGIEYSEVPTRRSDENKGSGGPRGADAAPWRWCALSVGRLHTPSREYEYFLREKPFAVIGSTIYVYRQRD